MNVVNVPAFQTSFKPLMTLYLFQSFDEVFMPDYVTREIQNQGYTRPTPIQSQTWPIAFRYVVQSVREFRKF